MTRLATLSLALGFTAAAVAVEPAWAQSRAMSAEEPVPATASDNAPQPNATAPGPVIFVVDSTRHIAEINVGSLRVRVLGRVNVPLTDIAFNPTNRSLYGVSYNGLYQVPLSTLQAKLIARLPVNDANALVFDSSGTAYFAGYHSNRLYKVDVATGRSTIVGLTGQYYSAGDLTFYNGRLVMSANYRTTNPNNDTHNFLITLNPSNAAIIGGPVPVAVRQLYGLASTGNNELYGLGGIATSNRPGLYQLFPSAAGEANRSTLLRNLSGTGLSLVVGTAYNGNFQP